MGGKNKNVIRKKIVKIPFIEEPRIPKADFPRFPELYFGYLDNPKKVDPRAQYIAHSSQLIPTSKYPSKDVDGKTVAKEIKGSNKKDDFISLKDIEKDPELRSLLKDKSGSKKKSKERNRSKEKSKERNRSKDKNKKDTFENFMKKGRTSIMSKSSRNERKSKDHPMPPPKIEEIEANGVGGSRYKTLNRIAQKDMSSDALKRELLFKIEVMRKQYPKLNLPTYSMTNSVDQIRNTIDSAIRNVMLESTITKYRRYFVAGLFISEYFFVKILKMGYMNDSTNFHMKSMSEYDIMIIELGEKSYNEGSDWPVELRLLGLAFLNTILYGLSRRFDMPDLINILTQFMNIKVPDGLFDTSSKQQPEPQFVKMKGPSVKVDLPIK